MLREINELELDFISGADAMADSFFRMPIVTNICGAIYGFGAGAIGGAIAGGVAGGFATGGILGAAGGTLGYVFTCVWGAVNGAIMGALKGYDFVVANVGNDAMFANWMALLTWDGAHNNPVVKG